MSIVTLLLIVLLVVVLGGAPGAPWAYQHNLGWGPSGVGGLVILVLLILLLTGRL